MSDCSMKMKRKHFLCHHLKCDDLTFEKCFTWYPPHLIEIFSLILNSISLTQQYVVSLDFFHLFLMFHPHAGASFKQNDMWRMQLNVSYKNCGLNLWFLFITDTVQNKSMSLFFLSLVVEEDMLYMCVNCISSGRFWCWPSSLLPLKRLESVLSARLKCFSSPQLKIFLFSWFMQ